MAIPTIRYNSNSMRIHLLTCLLASWLLGSAPAPGSVFVESDLDVLAAETPWRWVGYLNSYTPCPGASPGWSVSPLFDPSLWPGVPMLAKFCVYETEAMLPTVLLPTASVGEFFSLRPDRIVVSTAGADEALKAPFEQQLFEHSDWTPLSADPTSPGVRLSLIDTTPTLGDNPGNLQENSGHGYSLGRMLENWLCDPSQCLASIMPRLALSRVGHIPYGFGGNSFRDQERGGRFGTISELAQAIGDELAAWHTQLHPKPKLVINLSVAWDPIYGGLEPLPELMSPDVMGVFHAIQTASCQGAVVVAASGNQSDRRGDAEGPMLPAAWMERTLPCHSAPMLYAVSGVRADGTPLANARLRSASPFAAYADHATLVSSSTSHPTSVLTGSSVAAAMVSATAAAIAHHRPSLTAPQIMNIIHASGTVLPRQADFFHGGPIPPLVGYASFCRAITTACYDGSWTCRTPPVTCGARTLATGTIPEAVVDTISYGSLDVKVSSLTSTYPENSVCGLENPKHDPDLEPTDPCPRFQRYGQGSQPWTGPQPNHDPCPNCLVIRDDPIGTAASSLRKDALELRTATLYYVPDPAFSGVLEDPTLILCPGTRGDAYSLKRTSTGKVSFSGIPLGNCNHALLSFSLDSGISMTVPLWVSD